MAITEDDVKNAVAAWLKGRGFKNVEPRFGTSRGPDIEGVSSSAGRRLVVECKGETDAPNQRDRGWRNVSEALFKAIEKTENGENTDDVAVALPDTENYRRRMGGLQAFCSRQTVAVFWVSEDGGVQPW